MAQAPVAASAYARFAVPQMAFAKRLSSLRVAPAVDFGKRRLGAYAGHFSEGFEQLGLDALGIVFQMAS